MAELAVILTLIVLNALAQSAYARWRTSRRARHAPRPATRRPGAIYPLHPSPVAGSFGMESLPEHAASIRPAGIDW